MRLLSRKKERSEKFKIPDYTKLHLNMLLYKSRQHYETWILFNENIPDDLKEQFRENPEIILPDSFWVRMVNFPHRDFLLSQKEFLVPPLIVDTFDFTEEDLNLVKDEYHLFDSERETGRCPFCRVDLSNPHMRILSEKPIREWGIYTRGTVKGGGVSALCIHLLFKDDYESLSPDELWMNGWQMGPELKDAVKRERRKNHGTLMVI